MVGYPIDKWDLVGFQISDNKNKKYDALIQNKETQAIKKIGFGSRVPLMEHYRDTTGLNKYSDLDHNDEKRKIKYQQRFKNKFDPNNYSGTYFSWKKLWT